MRSILLVDDNQAHALLFKRAVGEHHDLAVHIALGAVEAQAFLAKRGPFAGAPTPDLIIVDLAMPVFTGHSLLPVIRRDPALKTAKVVVLTDSDNDEDRRRCHEFGVDDYVLKPIDFVKWREVIAELLARHLGVSAPGGRRVGSDG